MKRSVVSLKGDIARRTHVIISILKTLAVVTVTLANALKETAVNKDTQWIYVGIFLRVVVTKELSVCTNTLSDHLPLDQYMLLHIFYPTQLKTSNSRISTLFLRATAIHLTRMLHICSIGPHHLGKVSLRSKISIFGKICRGWQQEAQKRPS